MTKKQFNLYTEHLWKMREYLSFCEQFDYPWCGGLKSYFFRSHKECWENLSDHEQWLIESSLIDEVSESNK